MNVVRFVRFYFIVYPKDTPIDHGNLSDNKNIFNHNGIGWGRGMVGRGTGGSDGEGEKVRVG